MRVEILYCVVWNYESRAAGLAAELEQEFGATVTLRQGSGGMFEVSVDGTPVFSKRQVKRHAQPGEVAQLIRASRKEQ